ncbi:MAG: phospholipase D-like domain-containing protein, partial [Anaerovoracaceae bacterium]
TVGSTNFDRRSFKLNFECNAFIYSAEQTIKMEETFRKDMEKCHELTRELYNSRSIWIRIKEPCSRLLSAIL